MQRRSRFDGLIFFPKDNQDSIKDFLHDLGYSFPIIPPIIHAIATSFVDGVMFIML